MNKSKFNEILNNYKTSRRAFDELYAYYFHRIVFHVAWRFGKNIAEDVAQEFFIKLMRIELDEPIEHPATWVYTVADNIAKSYVKKFKQYDELKGDEFYEIDDGSDGEMLKKAVSKLDDIDSKIVYMYYWEGYSLKEIAPILGYPYETVKKRHLRAMKKLNKILKELSL